VNSNPPVNQLGFDPILSHPTLEDFQDLIKKKKGTTKGLIMDQAFSAGVGNVSASTSDVERSDRSGWLMRSSITRAYIQPVRSHF